MLYTDRVNYLGLGFTSQPNQSPNPKRLQNFDDEDRHVFVVQRVPTSQSLAVQNIPPIFALSRKLAGWNLPSQVGVGGAPNPNPCRDDSLVGKEMQSEVVFLEGKRYLGKL